MSATSGQRAACHRYRRVVILGTLLVLVVYSVLVHSTTPPPCDNCAAHSTQDTVTQCFNLGVEYMNKQHFSRALECFETALGIQGTHVPSLLNLGSIYLRSGQFSQAEEVYQRARVQDKNNYQVYHGLGLAAAQQGKSTEARSHLERALKGDAKNIEVLTSLAGVYQAEGDIEKSIRTYYLITQVNPQDFLARAQLGVLLSQYTQDIQEAIQQYRVALKIEPKNSMVHNNIAMLLEGRGELDDALKHYKNALKYDPSLVQAIVNGGQLMARSGDGAAAIKLMSRAVAKLKKKVKGKKKGSSSSSNSSSNEVQTARASMIQILNALGTIQAQMGDAEAGVGSMKQVITLQPSNAEAHNNLGNTLRSLRRYDESLHHFTECIKHVDEANSHIPLENKCAVLSDMDRVQEAITTCKKAQKLNQDSHLSHALLGSLYQRTGQDQEAVRALKRSVELQQTPAALNNLGTVLHKLGRFEEALQYYKQALKAAQAERRAGGTRNDIAPACERNIGNTLVDLRQYRQALKPLSRAIRQGVRIIKESIPTSDEKSNQDSSSSSSSSSQGKGRSKEPLYQAALLAATQPFIPAATTVQEGYVDLVQARAYSAEWDNHRQYFATLRHLVTAALYRNDHLTLNPFQALSFPWTGAELLQISEDFTRQVLERPALQALKRHSVQDSAHLCESVLAVQNGGGGGGGDHHRRRRLRVGYVSSDIGAHALTHLMRSVFAGHNDTVVQVFMYTLNADDGSDLRAEVARSSGQLKDVSALSLQQVYETIHADCLDVLINLNGYTRKEKSEIFAAQPTSLQLHYMGYAGSLGANFIPYMVTDKTVSPPEFSQYFSEKLLYVPHSYFVNSHRAYIKSPALDPTLLPSKSDIGLPTDKFIYACFCGLQKIDPIIFTQWVTILQTVPNSVLWLLRFPSDGEPGIISSARAAGIDPTRLIFSDMATPQDHILRAAHADVFLDTPAYNAHTTACDALWAGVPVVTLLGRTGKMADRVAASLLHAAQLPQLITHTLDDYTALAISLGQNPQGKLQEIRGDIKQRLLSMPLFDAAQWTRDYERLLQLTWEMDQLVTSGQRMHVIV